MVESIVSHSTAIFWGLVATGVTGLITYLIKLMMGYSKQSKAIKDGVLWLQHDVLLRSCKDYLRSKELDADEMENLEGLYKSYKALGGNGTITRLYERVLDLDIKDHD